VRPRALIFTSLEQSRCSLHRFVRHQGETHWTDCFISLSYWWSVALQQFRTEKDDEELAAAEERRQTKAITAQKTASSSSSNSSGSQGLSYPDDDACLG